MNADTQPTTTVRIGTFRDGRPALMTVRRPSLLELLRDGATLTGSRARSGRSRPPYADPAHLHALLAPRPDPAGTTHAVPEQPADPHPRT
ncbi:hypothetical protein [Streptomyces sp. bgisy060]|uniref:hypothetical protein n=1 Tax=Streptomyces sp. bgisy060 TaxID=3413775 RepID=UPI003EBDB374